MAVAGEDSAAYVGLELVAGSGTGELAGISGQVRIDNLPDGGQVLTLDYEPG
jgi:Protein of unknown function (DUF3224)